MYGACSTHHDTAYCLCFERYAKTIMTAKEYEYFMAKFSRYNNEVLRPLSGSAGSVSASDRRWSLNEIKNRCAN